jgi:hypothetical protein
VRGFISGALGKKMGLKVVYSTRYRMRHNAPIPDRNARPGIHATATLSGFRVCALPSNKKLLGNTTELKEAVLGIEVFGPEPGYDTHSDPVVWMEASKLRDKSLVFWLINNLRNFVKSIYAK